MHKQATTSQEIHNHSCDKRYLEIKIMKILALKFIYRSFKKSDSEFMRMGNQCYDIEASLNALKPNGN